MKRKSLAFLRTTLKVLCLAALLLSTFGPARALDARQPLTQYTHSVWQTESGLPQNTVHRVIQTRDGYIWLATDGGLARFDGTGFTVFDKQNTPALVSDQIRNLMEDRDGSLWICTPDGLLTQRDLQFRRFTTADGLSSQSVWSTLQDQSGTLWIVSTSGLTCYTGGRFTNYSAADGLPSDAINIVVEDRSGAIWIGSSDGLACFKNGKFKSFNSTDESRTDVRAIFEDRQHRLWVGTNAGLYLLANGRLEPYRAKVEGPINNVESIAEDGAGRIWVGTSSGLNQLSDTEVKVFTTVQGLPSNRVQSLYQDREGQLWVSTESGLARFDGDKFTSFPSNDALSSLTVLSIFEDRENNLWLGTESGGLHLLKDSKFQSYTTDDGLSSNLIRAICQDRRSNIWIGSSGGGLNLIRDGRVTVYTTKDGLSSNVVLAVCADRNDDLWAGTPDGLNRFHNGKFETFTSSNGLADDFVRSIYQDSSGRLWIGTRRGLSSFKDGKFDSFTTLDGLPNDYVGAILEDGLGNLWISTLGGLSRFKGGVFTNYSTKDGLSSNVVTSLYEDRDHNLWIGTNGNGLNVYREGKFAAFTTKNGLFDDVIYQILEDGGGNLWISCDKGIFRVSKKSLLDFADGKSAGIQCVSYGPADGMKTRECNGGGHPAGMKAADGKLWFSTLKGVAVTDPDHIRSNALPPPVVIEQVLVEDQPIDFNGKVELSPGRNRIAFKYAALSFVAPEKVQFKYKLEGADRDWRTPAAGRTAYYTNLPPGDYTFRVIACNNDGVWNQTGIALPLHLAPHFYQTYWFYALCLILFALLCWQLYLLRVRRIQSEFSAVLGERNRIAREIHDTLTQGLTGISLQLELVAKMLSVSADAAKTHLNQARLLARECLDDARRSVWDMRSQALEDSDLPTSLSSSARRLTANTGTQAQIRVSGPYRKIDPAIESNLLRIGQEAINNAVKHAKAGLIDVGLEFDPGLVRLSVRDDGCGFDGNAPAAPSEQGHFGLLGMRERAEQIGGKLTVKSNRGSGTEVSVEVPLGT